MPIPRFSSAVQSNALSVRRSPVQIRQAGPSFSLRQQVFRVSGGMQRVCRHHGLTEFILEGRGTYRCKACRVEHVSRRRRQMKLTLIEEHGGKCEECGYDKCVDALEFHHRDPTAKEFSLNGGRTKGIDRLRVEAEKCALLCANCHREVHAGIRVLGSSAVDAPAC